MKFLFTPVMFLSNLKRCLVDDLMQRGWTTVLLLCIIMLGQRGPFFCCAYAYDGKVPFVFL